MNTALTATNRPTTLHDQLVDLARCARRAGTAQSTTSHHTTLPMGEWLLFLADDLQQHASVLNLLDGDDASFSRSSGSACQAGELTQQRALKAIELALEQIGNAVRERLIYLSPTSLEARRLDDLLQSLDMHWWVCHRAAA